MFNYSDDFKQCNAVYNADAIYGFLHVCVDCYF